MSADHKPTVATNREDETVAGALTTFWQHWLDAHVDPPDIAIASAYFNPGGWRMLADQLEGARRVRLLLGAEPDIAQDMYRRRQLGTFPDRSEIKQERVKSALRRHNEDLAEDRNLIAFQPEQDELLERMVAWLRSDSVEVRRLESDFLHGKAYILETDGDGVLVGSSNLTAAGLARNIELNLGQYNPKTTGEVQSWFEELWKEAAPYDLAGLYDSRFDDHAPFVVFVRMLLEKYRDEQERAEVPTGLSLLDFQVDGVQRAHQLLDQFNGVLVADGVGLGKTYVAGELMRHANRDLRQKVLLIAPAALRDGPWEQFLNEHVTEMNVEKVSFDELSMDRQVLGDSDKLKQPIDDYAMIVIDEAHAYRNTDTDRSEALRILLSGTPQKQLVLLTATPVNNSLMDLYNLLAYYIRNDGAFMDLGIPSLRRRFAEAESTNPDELSPDALFDILDAVAVRRTRRFIKQFYPGTTFPDGTVITFPQPEVRRIDYDLDDVLPGFFEDFAYALGVDPNDPETPIPDIDAFEYDTQLSLARYAPSVFALDKDQVDQREIQAAGLLRSGLLKRFESSAYAFARTCRKMAASHDDFLSALDEGWVLTGDALAAYRRTDTDEFDPDEIAGGGTREPASDYRLEELREAVASDRDLLLQFAVRAETVTADIDPKLEALKAALGEIAEKARQDSIGEQQTRTNRKVLLFSYYADTVDWIYDHLEGASSDDPRLADYVNRITFVSGSEGDKSRAMFGFAPESSQAPPGRDEDRYDLLVATDVLAEGVNLQQARHIINYDLPWNPMRLVQRHGRIDRIGSPHDRVWLRCFFPSKLLDDLLGLEDAIQRKITQAAKTIGVSGEIVPGATVEEHTFADKRDTIKSIKDEDATYFETHEEGGALSGEEFRRILEDALRDPYYEDKIRHLPWVAGSGRTTTGTPGFIFCARVGDHPEPIYRWLPADSDGRLTWEEPHEDDAEVLLEGKPMRPRVMGLARDSLAALGRAECSRDTERVLPDEWRRRAYDAWDAAKQDIIEHWQVRTDPQNLQPSIPKPMRDAVQLLEEWGPTTLEAGEIDRLREALEAPYNHRTQRAIRHALQSADEPLERVQAVIDEVERLGLEPTEGAGPLPEILDDDVHLVCWMALLPE